jgi:hypothetical protein
MSFDPSEVSVLDSEEHSIDARSKDAVLACSGYAACIHAGYSEEQARTGCEDDFDRAGALAEDSRRAAKALLGKELNIRAVRMVANRLLELRTIDYDHFAILMQVTDGECSEQEYRDYIEARRQLGMVMPMDPTAPS